LLITSMQESGRKLDEGFADLLLVSCN